MPQRPKQKPLEEQSRFVQLLYEYMWRQRPPLKSSADLADHVQMNRQTIYQWLHKDVVPQPGTLMLFVQHTNMSTDEIRDVFASVNYPAPYVSAGEPKTRTALYMLQRLAEQDQSLTDSQRKVVMKWLMSLNSSAFAADQFVALTRNGHDAAQDCAAIPG